MAAACGFCSTNNTSSRDINFEAKYPISEKFPYSPNIDFVINNSPESRFKVFAIECKFSETYNPRAHYGISPKYIELNKIWDNMSNLLKLAKEISPNYKDNKFTHLHPAQLIKHILGLNGRFGKNKFRFITHAKSSIIVLSGRGISSISSPLAFTEGFVYFKLFS